jgi:ssDNA-binding Zn-finger/Zn-ribbon topoisomerase 1
MVIRLGRNGRFLACSEFPEHKESRPLPEEAAAAPELPGTGGPCPKCGEGTLTGKRGKFGPFVGCSRYPDCDHIVRDGPPPPDQLPFEVRCPKNGDGHLLARRARRTGNVFWGCSAYPKCDYTTNFAPIGAVHDADDGPVATRAEGLLCLRCGATIEPVADSRDPVGARLSGGPPDPAALARRPAKGRRGGGAGRGAGRTGRAPRAGRATGKGGRGTRRREAAADT